MSNSLLQTSKENNDYSDIGNPIDSKSKFKSVFSGMSSCRPMSAAGPAFTKDF